MREKVIGILGGMGPEATIDLFSKIVRLTGAKKDQDHLRILIDSNPKIPDRTLAIQGKGPSPLPMLIRSAKTLEQAGADLIVIPCVTAHHFHERLRKRIGIPVLHVVEETARFTRAHLKGVRKVGLIATTGTVQTGLFQKFYSEPDEEVLLPSPEIQETKVMKAIYGKTGIKAIGPSEGSKRLIIQASQTLIRKGAQAIIAGCTEIPLVLKDEDLSIRVVDPLSVLALSAIREARSDSQPPLPQSGRRRIG
jgi:aspartate racemase